MLTIAGVIAALGMTACGRQPVETAVEGAASPVTTAIGPIPGPLKVVEQQKNPFAGNQVATMEGRKLFVRYNCYGCHGGHGGGGMGPSLRDQSWTYGNSDAHVYSSIAEGRAYGMPTWGLMLPQEDIWKLVAYIKAMRTSSEPEAPARR